MWVVVCKICMRVVIHNGVKCDHVLVGQDGKAKLSCFYFCTRAGENELPQRALNLQGVRWRAPELFQEKRPSFASDVYSFGMCIIEAATGKLPWGNHQSIVFVKARAAKGQLPQNPSNLTKFQWQLVQRMCCVESTSRPSMHEVAFQLKRFVAIEREVNYHLDQLVESGFKLLPNDRLLAQDMVMENFIRNHSRRIEVEELDDEFDSESDEDKPNRLATVFIEAADQVDNFEEELQEARRDASVNITETYLMNPELEQGTSTLAVGSDWQIDPKDVERFERIGNGGFGEVYRGTWLGAPVAIKVVGTAQDPDGILFRNELDIWFSLNHPHIVNLFGASDGKTRFFVCDLADVDKGHLGSSSKSFDKRNVWKMLYQTASALQCLHARGILHGDLKGDNVLITMDNLAQLTDFGLSFVKTGLQTKSLTTCALQWTAPECLRGERVTSISDVYGLGMSIIQAISGDIPWPNRKINAVLRHELMENKLPCKRPGGFRDIEWGLVRRMSLFEKEERLKLPLVVKVLGEFAFDKLSNIRDRIFMSKMVHDWKLCDHAKEARKPPTCVRHFRIPSISTA